MEVSRKLKIYAVLTFFGLVMMTVSFVSPGWSSISVHKPAPPRDFILESETIIINKRSADHHYEHRRGPHVHFSLGLWYYVVCYRDCDKERPEIEAPPNPETNPHELPKDVIVEDEISKLSVMPPPDKNKCHFSTYRKSRGLPGNFMFASSAYRKVTTIGKKGLLEFQIEASLALFCGLVGFVASIVYARGLGQTRRSGLVACMSLILSGALYLAAVGKTVSSTEMYKAIYGIQHSETVRFHCPWGLYVGGVSALFVLISAIGHLFVLSRTRTPTNVYHIHRDTEQGTYVYSKQSLETKEEAGPLPEKEII